MYTHSDSRIGNGYIVKQLQKLIGSYENNFIRFGMYNYMFFTCGY